MDGAAGGGRGEQKQQQQPQPSRVPYVNDVRPTPTLYRPTRARPMHTAPVHAGKRIRTGSAHMCRRHVFVTPGRTDGQAGGCTAMRIRRPLRGGGKMVVVVVAWALGVVRWSVCGNLMRHM